MVVREVDSIFSSSRAAVLSSRDWWQHCILNMQTALHSTTCSSLWGVKNRQTGCLVATTWGMHAFQRDSYGAVTTVDLNLQARGAV
jgi:hypothetical protein